MNLYELIQHIPEFIVNTLNQTNAKNSEKPPMIGKFYLGLNYDYHQTWMNLGGSSSSKDSRAKESGVAIYPCS